MRLKVNKCEFGMTTLYMLGHVADQYGVHPNPEKVKAIKEFPRPKDVKSLQSFIGLCSYIIFIHIKLIQNFANLARPLTTMTKATASFVWEEEQETSMQLLKQALIDSVVLSHPDYSYPMEIHPDASSYGIGAVLDATIKLKRNPFRIRK